MGKRYKRKNQMRRSYLKQYTLPPATFTPNKEVLRDYSERAQGVQRDEAGNIQPFTLPMTQIYPHMLRDWATKPPPKPQSAYKDAEGKLVVVDNYDECPPRIRVLLKLKEQGFLRDYYCVNLADGKYTKVDLFFGASIFFIQENVLRGEFLMSMTFSSKESAKDKWFNHPEEIVWKPVG